MKICSKCKVDKKYEEYHKDKTTKDGLSYSCKECKSKQTKEFRLKNPERAKEKNKKNFY